MIPVTRSAEPPVLQRNGARWLTALQAAIQKQQQIEQAQHSSEKLRKKKRAQAKKVVDQAQGKYKHEQTKTALVAMFQGKCAYCESKIDVVTYGAIEHFRPKSKYPELTFTWSNLLLACDRCNDRGHKGERFPLDVEGNPLLIDPTDPDTDPQAHLDFVWDPKAGLASIYGRDNRGRTVEEVFDLNGLQDRQSLMDYRSKIVKHLQALLWFAQNNDQAELRTQEAWGLLREACQANAEYSAFALQYIAPYLPPLSS